MIKTHRDLSDEEFKEQFIRCTFNPVLFDHEAHLRIAWLLIDDLGINAAVTEVQKQLQNFAQHNNGMDKYHDTVTVAATKIMSHYMSKSTTESFIDFIDENPKLTTNFKDLLESHYSFDVFASVKAKNTYVEPDLRQFK